MKVTEKIMGMDTAIELLDHAKSTDFDHILEYLYQIDELFNLYKKTSDLYKINAKKLKIEDAKPEVKKILRLADLAKKVTNGYFDINIEDHLDPSGLVIGFALDQSAQTLKKRGYRNFYIEIGGNLQVAGFKNGNPWKVGITNSITNSSRVANVTDCGIATSGIAQSGLPIYNPHKKKVTTYFKSVTILSPSIYDSGIYATASFAMGEKGVEFIEDTNGVEGYFVLPDGSEIMTKNLKSYI